MALGRSQDKGLGLKLAHTRLLPHIPFEGGIRLTELAELAGITKQSVQALVDELVQAGQLKKTNDPHDGRAKLITYTAQGRKGVLKGLAVFAGLDGELEARLGTSKTKAFERGLDALLLMLNEDADA